MYPSGMQSDPFDRAARSLVTGLVILALYGLAHVIGWLLDQF